MTTAEHPHRTSDGQRRWLLLVVPAIVVALVVAGPYVTFSFSRVELRASALLHIVFFSLHDAGGPPLPLVVPPLSPAVCCHGD